MLKKKILFIHHSPSINTRQLSGCVVKKINKLNNLLFFKSFGMNNINLKKKKFDLIVANLLLNEHKSIITNVCKHIKRRGFYFISGILDSQINYFIVLLRCFNLRLYDSMKLNGWACLVFRKY